MNTSPRTVITPHRPIALKIPSGMTPVEFFNSPCNLRNLAEENGLLRTREDFLMYRKALGHSLTFDTSIIHDTSRRILDPLGRPVRRDQLTPSENRVWSRMTQTVFDHMLVTYPDPDRHLVFCGEASLDATWPMSKPGVPSIRMIHNHFIAYEKTDLHQATPAEPDNANLTDSGHHGLFLKHLSPVYRKFFEILDLKILQPISTQKSRLRVTGYPQGLPSWEIEGGAESMRHARFWHEYDLVLKGFLDFYRTFFNLVSSREPRVPAEAYFPDQVEDVLLFDNNFFRVAKDLRQRVMEDPQFANEIRWRPAYKQIIYRDDAGRLIVTISQNSVGNAITELLGIVVKRVTDAGRYEKAERALVEQLLAVRERLIASDLGEPIHGPQWPDGAFRPYAESLS